MLTKRMFLASALGRLLSKLSCLCLPRLNAIMSRSKAPRGAPASALCSGATTLPFLLRGKALQ